MYKIVKEFDLKTRRIILVGFTIQAVFAVFAVIQAIKLIGGLL